MSEPLERYFKILELEPNAKLEQIKQSWRILSQIWHPDKHVAGSKAYDLALRRQKELNEAYAILSKHSSLVDEVKSSPNSSGPAPWWHSQPKEDGDALPGGRLPRPEYSDDVKNKSAEDEAPPSGWWLVPQQDELTKHSKPHAARIGEKDWSWGGRTVRDDNADIDPSERVARTDGSHYAAKRASDSSEWECINWDAWRNQFLYMVCLRVQDIMANPGARNLKWNKTGKVKSFPLGVRMTFACDVLPGRKIGDVIVLEASGNKNFDDLILAGIRELDGAPSLEFPPGSTRAKVTQVGLMGVSDRFEFNSQEYGDNERTSKTKRSSSNR